MDLSLVRPGSLLEIYIRRGGFNYKVVSKIEYVDDEIIGVSPIASKTQLFKFLDTDTVDVVCKQDDHSWKWANVKPGYKELDDGTKLHTFKPFKEAESFNRRSTFRLPIYMEIMISYEKPLFDNEEDGAAPQKDDSELTIDEMIDQISERYCELNSKAFLKDISEGGAAISTDALFEKGDMISFDFELAFEQVKCKAVVVRVKKNEKNEFYNNYYGVSFVETSTNFVKCFFAEQRKSITKSRFNFDK